MRKIFTLLFLVICSISSSAQEFETQLEYQKLEQRRAEKKMAFNVNPNTQNYDIRYHKLELTIDPNVYFVSGKVTSRFVPTENLNTIVFDLSHELSVSLVKQGAATLTFSHSNNQLTINLNETVAIGEIGEVEITYSGAPPTQNEAFTKSFHNGIPIIWTLSEPFGAKDWWPCKEDLNDKIENLDVYITSPNAYTSVSNGLELGQVSNLNNTKTTHFQHNYAIPAYLVAIAVTNYQIFTQTAGTEPNTFPVVNYLYPESYQSVLPQLQQTLLIMDLFEDLFETYPFHDEKYGHAQFGWGGGMEHTTVSFMGSFSRSLIAHELGHHWFGNKITCGTWRDIWINEGFAEYMSGLVVEHLDGLPEFVEWKQNKINHITSLPGGNVYLTETQAQNSNRIFDSRLTYNKGSMIVHMLREVLGDEDFYQAVRNILQDPDLAYKAAVTPEIIEHFETVSGLDLTTFFDNWLYNQGYPTYSIGAQNVNNGQIQMTLSQTTSHNSVSFFAMPVKVLLVATNGEEEVHVLQNTVNEQTFVLDTNLPNVDEIIINPYKDIICKTGTVVLSNNQNLFLEEIKIYPVPVEDKFFIEIPTDSKMSFWSLYNSEGKKIIQDKNHWADISALANGVYIIELMVNDKYYHKKIVKQ